MPAPATRAHPIRPRISTSILGEVPDRRGPTRAGAIGGCRTPLVFVGGRFPEVFAGSVLVGAVLLGPLTGTVTLGIGARSGGCAVSGGCAPSNDGSDSVETDAIAPGAEAAAWNADACTGEDGAIGTGEAKWPSGSNCRCNVSSAPSISFMDCQRAEGSFGRQRSTICSSRGGTSGDA